MPLIILKQTRRKTYITTHTLTYLTFNYTEKKVNTYLSYSRNYLKLNNCKFKIAESILQIFANRSILSFARDRTFVSAQVRLKNCLGVFLWEYRAIESSSMTLRRARFQTTDIYEGAEKANTWYRIKYRGHVCGSQVFGCLSYNRETYDYRHRETPETGGAAALMVVHRI